LRLILQITVSCFLVSFFLVLGSQESLQGMEVKKIQDPSLYLKVLKRYLDQEATKELKIKCNLLLSVVRKMVSAPSPDHEMYLIKDNLEPAILRLVAIRTPPLKLIVGFGDDQAITGFAEYLVDNGCSSTNPLPGIVASKEVTKVFCAKYFSLTGLSCGLVRRELSQVLELPDNQIPKRLPEGRLISAKENEHFPTLVEWFMVFAIECEMPTQQTTREFAEISIRQQLEKIVLWEITECGNPKIVSMASGVPCDKNIIRIGLVYTPKDYRGRGYSSVLVNLLSKSLIDQGKICVLYSDASNPVSNAIYRNIGYRILSNEANTEFIK
jgi:RimJ/RimL family protein N-acetyltransferase